jgi:Doubled CXXCH motif (Paired_CXXCH_1)
LAQTTNETGKERQARIQQDYFGRDRMVRWRSWTALAAMLGALGWWLMAPVWISDHGPSVTFFQRERLASPGPLAQAHAAWDATCTACHVPFEPIKSSEWSQLGAIAHPHSARGGDTNCQRCHMGPSHHQTQIAVEVPACAECHRDHRGRDARLARSDDETCTRCHANLTAHRQKDSGIAPAVVRFDQDRRNHPEFAVIANQKRAGGGDPGKLKFNHSLHLASGLSLRKEGKSFPLFTYAQLLEPDRLKFGWNASQQLDSPVQLDCAACHQLDREASRTGSRGSSPSGAPPRSAGKYMLPITYENHCRACHPLNFEPQSRSYEVRHGRTPSEVLAEVRQFYAAQVVNDNPDLLRRVLPRRPMPGKDFEGDVDVRRVRQAVDDKILVALRVLFGSGRKGCIECHEMSPIPFQLSSPEQLDDAKITPVMVPEVWLQHALFDHSAHRALQCLQCHPQASSSASRSDILLPGIENCLRCHGPAEVRGGVARGGAGSNCTECHRYHNGDRTLEGKGSSARGVIDRQTIEHFLNGKAN